MFVRVWVPVFVFDVHAFGVVSCVCVFLCVCVRVCVCLCCGRVCSCLCVFV